MACPISAAGADTADFEPDAQAVTTDGNPPLFSPMGMWIMFRRQRVSERLPAASLRSSRRSNNLSYP